MLKKKLKYKFHEGCPASYIPTKILQHDRTTKLQFKQININEDFVKD